MHRFTDKGKAFFKKVTKRRRAGGGNEDLALTAHQAGGDVRESVTDSMDCTPEFSVVVTDSATSVARTTELHDAKPSAHAIALQPPNQNPCCSSSSQSNIDTPPSATTSYFTNANAFSIGQFSTGNVQHFGSAKTLFEYLEPYISHGAAHNSSERCDAPICDPETRRAIQEEIFGWMRDGKANDRARNIMWLAGPAGSGKTAIAGSVAESCHKAGLLAASFFFSSFSESASRYSKRCVVATIALHLAEHEALYRYKAQLLDSIERNPSIFHKRLIDQAHHLLLQPLRAVQEQSDRTGWPKSILLDGLDEIMVKREQNAKGYRIRRTDEGDQLQVVDGLDEIVVKQEQDAKAYRTGRMDEGDQLEVLDVVLALAKDPAFPFRIFISSRPERVIKEFFSTVAQATTVKLFLDSKYDPDADIERFLRSRFSIIQRRYGIHDSSWPGQQVIARIIEMSSGQFIIPATVVRHVEAGVPQRQLDDIMQLTWEEAGRRNPFAVVDALYSYILRRSPDPFLAARWLRVYTCATEPIPALYFRQLVEDVEGEFHHVLGPLSSLISIPKSDGYETPLVVYHKSLADYLSSQYRCAEFYLSGPSVQAFVADRCVRVLSRKGPSGSLHHSPRDIGRFLDVFYATTLVNMLSISRKGYFVRGQQVPFELVPRSFADSLLCMSPEARNQLALCDVEWWTRFCLDNSEYQTQRFGTVFIGGMYCGIHVNFCGWISTSTPQCHAACTRWRAGILAEAKTLNWCVHKLEEAGFSGIRQATAEWFNDKFKKMGKQENGSFATCGICQPHSTGRD